MAQTLKPDALADALRRRVFNPERRLFRLARIAGSSQEGDLSEPVNCDGFGRIHHFKNEAFSGWPKNPLPMAPAAAALGLNPGEDMPAQVFQLAACNYRCWYCFVPFSLLYPTEENSAWVSADEIVALYAAERHRASIVDCTGGQPDLAPEWIPEIMRSLTRAGLDRSTFLWSDDNLSGEFLWKYLTHHDIETMQAYENYARVGCFKGFDSNSFSFNTGAPERHFSRQFEIFERLLTFGFDQYAYVTFTGPPTVKIEKSMSDFVDRLQEIHEMLPLRTIPLKILKFGVLKARLSGLGDMAFATQSLAIECWVSELSRRFSGALLRTPITEIDLRQ